jgi:hypothetical protein
MLIASPGGWGRYWAATVQAAQSEPDPRTRLSNLPTYPLDRLSRYEATLWRQAFALTPMTSAARPIVTTCNLKPRSLRDVGGRAELL